MILMLGDEGLKDHVTRALGWDMQVDEAGIGVSVRDRTVTAPSHAHRRGDRR
jgi:hypothetical protein